MRRLTLITTLIAASVLLAPPAASHDRLRPPARTGAGIEIRLPAGWHLIDRRLTNVVEPVARLAIATFPVRLASHPCECGQPNIRNLPADGGFVFMWEYPALTPLQLRSLPRRPRHFHLTNANPQRFECSGPSWTTSFRSAGRGFQLEVYLGRAAGTTEQTRIDRMLDSLHITPRSVQSSA